MKDTQSKPEIRGLQTGISRAMMHTDIAASQIQDAVHYANFSAELANDEAEAQEGAVLVVRHELMSKMERSVLHSGPPDLVMYSPDPRLDIEITFVRENGSWVFGSVEFMARFGYSPWAYVTVGSHEVWRHDGQIIEWREDIAIFLKGQQLPKVRCTSKHIDDIEKSLLANVSPVDEDTLSPLRRFIDWLKS